ncbi:MAG: MFS transporter [Nitrososphaeria archaeon]
MIWTLFVHKVKIITTFETRKNAVNEAWESVLTRHFTYYLMSMAICQMGFVTIQTFITSYLVIERGLSEMIASLIFSIGPLIGILSSLFAGHFASRIGDLRFLALILIASAISALTMPFPDPIYILAMIYLIFTFFSHAIWTPMTAITASLTPANRRGLAYSLSMATFQLMFALTPPLVAKLIECTSFWIMFPLSCILILTGVIILRLSSTACSP